MSEASAERLGRIVDECDSCALQVAFDRVDGRRLSEQMGDDDALCTSSQFAADGRWIDMKSSAEIGEHRLGAGVAHRPERRLAEE